MGLDVHVAALGDWVPRFVRLNNRLAGIVREPTAAEVGAHRGLLAVNTLRVENLELFVHHVAPGAALRKALKADSTQDVSEWDVRTDFSTIVEAARTHKASPYRLHQLFRMLRPFTDGNGRCGRALWMWQVMRLSPEDLTEIAGIDLLDVRHALNSDVIAATTPS